MGPGEPGHHGGNLLEGTVLPGIHEIFARERAREERV